MSRRDFQIQLYKNAITSSSGQNEKQGLGTEMGTLRLQRGQRDGDNVQCLQWRQEGKQDLLCHLAVQQEYIPNDTFREFAQVSDPRSIIWMKRKGKQAVLNVKNGEQLGVKIRVRKPIHYGISQMKTELKCKNRTTIDKQWEKENKRYPSWNHLVFKKGFIREEKINHQMYRMTGIYFAIVQFYQTCRIYLYVYLRAKYQVYGKVYIGKKEKKSFREKVSFHNIARLPKQATEKFREHNISDANENLVSPSFYSPAKFQQYLRGDYKSNKKLLNTILGKVLSRDSVIKGS